MPRWISFACTGPADNGGGQWPGLSLLRSGRQRGGRAALRRRRRRGHDPRRVRGDGPEENEPGVHRPLRRGNPAPADRVIVCCGGMAGGKLGGTRSGYELLQSLGHSVTKLYPALVQMQDGQHLCQGSLEGRPGRRPTVTPLRRQQGRRGPPAGVKFSSPTIGVSGPAVFALSRAAAPAKAAPDGTLSWTCMPEVSACGAAGGAGPALPKRPGPDLRRTC